MRNSAKIRTQIIVKKINKRVFWDVNVHLLDDKLDKNFIITRVLERGTDKEIAVIESSYSKKEILEALHHIRGVSQKTINYYEIILE